MSLRSLYNLQHLKDNLNNEMYLFWDDKTQAKQMVSIVSFYILLRSICPKTKHIAYGS